MAIQRSLGLAVVLCTLAVLCGCGVANDDVLFGPEVIRLDDSTFEKQTQAASGATTGDWYVMFYAPWCQHCKNAAPAVSKLAEEVNGIANVAVVSCSDSSNTCARFKVDTIPMHLFFSRGRLYRFQPSGSRPLEEQLREFVEADRFTEGAASYEPVPTEVTFVNIVIKEFLDAYALLSQGEVLGWVAVGVLMYGVVLWYFMRRNTQPAAARGGAAVGRKPTATKETKEKTA